MWGEYVCGGYLEDGDVWVRYVWGGYVWMYGEDMCRKNMGGRICVGRI